MTFTAEVIISGFVSKAVNNCVDVSWNKIKNAVNNKNNKHQSLESQIYNVTVDVFNLITYNQYENNQDKIYEAAENLLTGYINNKEDDIEVIRSSLKLFYPNVGNDKCMEFMRLLYQELSKDVYGTLYREIRLLQEEQESRKTTRIEQKVDEIISGLDDLKSNSQMQYIPQNNVPKQKVKSRTQEYADKWNENMFLNDFDKRDKDPGVNVKLKDVYLESHLPHYIWKDNPEDNPSTDLKVLLSEYIDENNSNKMLLIMGQPGIGKSTLITWITANFTDRIDGILVYQFASDLKNIDWQNVSDKDSIANEILKELNLSYDILNGKTLIIDGFDEISVGNDRAEILNLLYWQMIKGSLLNEFSLVITCRENYIIDLDKISCAYITLQSWDSYQIESFCKVYSEKTNYNVSEYAKTNILKNKEIFGIPLILYMVLALNISVDKDGSIVDVYDQIFSLKGRGIYDRCLYEQPHRIGELKEPIHQISREISIWMFEHNADEACISQSEYEKICDRVMRKYDQENKEVGQDFLIGNYFRLVRHCEGMETKKLYFVHRSIYEYFVAETIYNSIENALIELSEESKKELAGNIAFFLKDGRITITIGEYLLCKINKLFQSLNNEKKEKFYEYWEETVEMMMKCGMFFFTGNCIYDYESIILKETNCFMNLLEILRLLIASSNQKYILENANHIQLEKYIRFSVINHVRKLSHEKDILNLSNMCFLRIYLSRVDFSSINLKNSNFRSANLSGANLRKANLRNVDLRKANLRNADLRKADLRDTNLSGANLHGANLFGAYVEASIWFESDIRIVLLQLKGTVFNMLLIEDGDKVKKVSRRELFPDENNSSNV